MMAQVLVLASIFRVYGIVNWQKASFNLIFAHLGYLMQSEVIEMDQQISYVKLNQFGGQK